MEDEREKSWWTGAGIRGGLPQIYHDGTLMILDQRDFRHSQRQRDPLTLLSVSLKAENKPLMGKGPSQPLEIEGRPNCQR